MQEVIKKIGINAEQIPYWERSAFLNAHKHLSNKAAMYGVTLEEIYNYCVNGCIEHITYESKEVRPDAGNRRVNRKKQGRNS